MGVRGDQIQNKDNNTKIDFFFEMMKKWTEEKMMKKKMMIRDDYQNKMVIW